jgi:3-dehydroquinate synthase
MQRLKVRSKHFEYDVVVGRGAWRALRRFPLGRYSSVFVLTEAGLWKRWGQCFQHESGLDRVQPVLVPAGEGSKTLRMVERLASQLLKSGADRQSLLLLFGGGVIGDLGGFLASTYMRGIDCVQVPTTVVAQVDSAVGGKTAVNTRSVKNLIGTFHPARLVVADPIVLTSLDRRAFRSGLYEVVKHAILVGGALFHALEETCNSLRADNIEILEPILTRALAVKVDVVNRDEREKRLRHVLNLGHTFGHALEEVTHYRRFLHGEAVGWGLLAVARVGRQLEVLGATQEERIARLVQKVGPLPPIGDLNSAKIVRLLPQDKKSIRGQIHWVIPERIGKVRIVTGVPLSAAAVAFRDLQRSSSRYTARPGGHTKRNIPVADD